MKTDIDGLLDFYIDKFCEEKEHNTDGYALAGMLQGLLWICRYFGISDEELGEMRFKKIRGDR